MAKVSPRKQWSGRSGSYPASISLRHIAKAGPLALTSKPSALQRSDLRIHHPEHSGVFPFADDLAERRSGAPDVIQHPALNLGLEWRLATVRQTQRVERIDH